MQGRVPTAGAIGAVGATIGTACQAVQVVPSSRQIDIAPKYGGHDHSYSLRFDRNREQTRRIGAFCCDRSRPAAVGVAKGGFVWCPLTGALVRCPQVRSECPVKEPRFGGAFSC